MSKSNLSKWNEEWKWEADQIEWKDIKNVASNIRDKGSTERQAAVTEYIKPAALQDYLDEHEVARLKIERAKARMVQKLIEELLDEPTSAQQRSLQTLLEALDGRFESQSEGTGVTIDLSGLERSPDPDDQDMQIEGEGVVVEHVGDLTEETKGRLPGGD